MTMTEVLDEIQKMPLDKKKELLEHLSREIGEQGESDADPPEDKEKVFLDNLYKKGLINDAHAKSSNDVVTQKNDRIEITGEPLSETIIKERG